MSQWNAAIDAAVKLLRSNADGCLPGSPAETQNWPFVLEMMAREVERLKVDSATCENGAEK